MIFNITTDMNLIRRVLTDDFIFENSSDDASKRDIDLSSFPFIAVTVETPEKLLGMFLLDPRNHIHYEVHTCLFKGLTAKESLEILNECYIWLFTHFPVLKVSTYIPSFNKRAIRFATFAGMKIEGNLIKSFLKNNILYDQLIMGINKEEVCQQ